jgi:manganese transport protein
VAALTPFLGPAFIAAVAYVDPGNFATNIAAGAKFGYALLWVVLAANLMAMIVQSLSAKLGIATGKNLAEVCRDRFSPRMTYFLWIQASRGVATDLPVTGAALGLAILFSLPLFLRGSSPLQSRSECLPFRNAAGDAGRR